MKYLEEYNNFVNEALLPSQYRMYVKEFKRKRYAELFQEYKEKYDGDRNAYRIYLPLETYEEENPLEIEITKFLEENGYEVLDYFRGACKFKDAKNPTKIGQVLTRLKANDLMKKFVEDPERKKGNVEELMVCISRHPYDIAGADTDRNWTDCMSLALPDIHPRIKRMKKEKDPKLPYYQQTGSNSRYLIGEVKEGSLVSYLIRKDDKNITNPLSVLNIKPYINDKGKVYLCASKREYGTPNVDFKITVENWLKEINTEKKGIFNIAPGIYRDCDPASVNPKGLTLKKWLKNQYGENIPYGNSELSCCGVGLTTLKGIEKFKNLQKLYCYSNQITSLEGIEGCTNLVDLQINDNRLTSLKGIEGLTKLKILYAQGNRIASIEELENLVNLEQVYLHSNNIRSLKGIEKLNKLRVFYINHNQISSTKEAENLKALYQIYINNNKINSLEGFKDLPQLTQLFVNHNKLKDLKGLEKLPKLTALVAYNNNLTSLDGLVDCKAINNLQINDNNLKSLEGVEDLKNLQSLYCQNNKITSLKELKNLTSLCTLDAKNNPLDKTEEDTKKMMKRFGIKA